MKKDNKKTDKKQKQQDDKLVHGDKSCNEKDFLSLLDKACKKHRRDFYE